MQFTQIRDPKNPEYPEYLIKIRNIQIIIYIFLWIKFSNFVKFQNSGKSKNPEQNCKFINILIELFTNPQNSKIPYKALDILDFLGGGNFFQILPSALPLMPEEQHDGVDGLEYEGPHEDNFAQQPSVQKTDMIQ